MLPSPDATTSTRGARSTTTGPASHPGTRPASGCPNPPIATRSSPAGTKSTLSSARAGTGPASPRMRHVASTAAAHRPSASTPPDSSTYRRSTREAQRARRWPRRHGAGRPLPDRPSGARAAAASSSPSTRAAVRSCRAVAASAGRARGADAPGGGGSYGASSSTAQVTAPATRATSATRPANQRLLDDRPAVPRSVPDRCPGGVSQGGPRRSTASRTGPPRGPRCRGWRRARSGRCRCRCRRG